MNYKLKFITTEAYCDALTPIAEYSIKSTIDNKGYFVLFRDLAIPGSLFIKINGIEIKDKNKALEYAQDHYEILLNKILMYLKIYNDNLSFFENVKNNNIPKHLKLTEIIDSPINLYIEI